MKLSTLLLAGSLVANAALVVTIARLTPLLGSPGAVEAYKQYGGQWVTNLVPRPRPAPVPPPARN